MTNYLALCDSPDKTDEFLAKLMVLEELEGQFIEFDEFTDQLAAKRDEVIPAFKTVNNSYWMISSARPMLWVVPASEFSPVFLSA